MSVTLLLTLKGRPLHTLRWFWHAERTRLPFPVIVADGGEDPLIERLLSDPASFPNVDYRYLRYHDRELKDYWFKLADATAQVGTPYVLMVDNDDFVLPDLIHRSVAYLDAHPGTVSAGGSIGVFGLHGEDAGLHVCGRPYAFSVKRTPEGYGQDTIMERISAYFAHRFYLFYNVTRTAALRDIYAQVEVLQPRNFDVWEQFLYLSLIIRGDVRFLPGSGYLRQLGTSQAQASNRAGWIHNLFFKGWMGDLDRVVAAVAASAQQAGAGEAEAVEARLRQLYYDMVAAAPLSAVPEGRTAGLRRSLRKLGPLRAAYAGRRYAAFLREVSRGLKSAEAGLLAAEIEEAMASLRSPELAAFIAGHKAECGIA